MCPLYICNIWKSHIWTAVKDVTTVYSPLHGFIWNQHSDQLPVGLLAQLVEHCTGIAEVMGSNPVQAWIFFRPSFHYYSSSVHYCEDRFHIQYAHSIYSESNLPFNRAIDSATASSGGGSMALFKNSLISPSFRNLMVRASSWSGVRKISGVACSASLSK